VRRGALRLWRGRWPRHRDAAYAPLAAGIGFAADRLNRLQFLTIRQFLSLVFGALVILLVVLAVWS
jgi:hypothetical protein